MGIVYYFPKSRAQVVRISLGKKECNYFGKCDYFGCDYYEGDSYAADFISMTIRLVIFLIKYFLTCECQTSAQRGNGWRISVSYL